MRKTVVRPADTRNRQHEENGSVLLLVMGTLAIISATAILALNRYKQNALTARTSNAKVESNQLFGSIQQSLSNQALCTNAITQNGLGASFQFPQPGVGSNFGLSSAPQANQPIGSLVGSLNGGNQVIAVPGMISNGVSLSSPGPNIFLNPQGIYSPLGLQPTTLPAGIAGNYCGQTTMSVLAQKGINRTLAGQSQTSNSPNASTYNMFGSATVQQDFPFTMLSDKTGKVVGCFAGQASGVCQPPIQYKVSPLLTIGGNCADGGVSKYLTQTASQASSTISWTITPEIMPLAETLFCNGTPVNIPLANSFTGGMMIGGTTADGSKFPLPVPASYNNCILKVTNSMGQTFTNVSQTPLSFRSDEYCDPILSLSVPACVYSGNTFTLNWTDQDSAADGASVDIVVSGNGAVPVPPGQPPVGSLPVTAPSVAAATVWSYAAIDVQSGDSSAPLTPLPSPSATITILPAPVPGNLSVSPTTYDVGVPTLLNFTWNAQGVTTVQLFVNGAADGNYAASPGTSIMGPMAMGTYQYSISASGSCGGTAATSNIVTVTVGPSPSPSPSASSGSCSTGTTAGSAVVEIGLTSELNVNEDATDDGTHDWFCGPGVLNGNGGNVLGQCRSANGGGSYNNTPMPLIEWSDIGLSIPAGANVLGIAVSEGMAENNGSSFINTVSLKSGGAVIATKTLNQPAPTSETIYTAGGPTDTWGLGSTITPAMISSLAVDYKYINTGSGHLFFFYGQAGQPSGQGVTVYYGGCTAAACGSATASVTEPTSNLCATGAASAVSGSGPWTWTCSNGVATTSCSASSTPPPPPPPPGVCTLTYGCEGNFSMCAGGFSTSSMTVPSCGGTGMGSTCPSGGGIVCSASCSCN